VSTDSRRPIDQEAAEPRPGETFLARFHRRKQVAREANLQQAQGIAQGKPVEEVESQQASPAPALTDADMPPLESLTIDSDYSGFLSTEVSEPLRRAALRKLFHSAELNVIDGLDDYAEDFTTFTALGDLVTAEMRHRIEIEAKRQAEAAQRALLDAEAQPADEQGPPGHAVPTRDEAVASSASDGATTTPNDDDSRT
jgi:hypothetical protein